MTQTFELVFVSSKPLDNPLARVRSLLSDMLGCEVTGASGQFLIHAQIIIPNASGDVAVRDVQGAVFDVVRWKTRQISLTNVSQVLP